MRRSLLLLSLCAASVHTVIAQSIGFTVFPQQVVTGLTYTVAWNSDGQVSWMPVSSDVRNPDIDPVCYY